MKRRLEVLRKEVLPEAEGFAVRAARRLAAVPRYASTHSATPLRWLVLASLAMH